MRLPLESVRLFCRMTALALLGRSRLSGLRDLQKVGFFVACHAVFFFRELKMLAPNKHSLFVLISFMLIRFVLHLFESHSYFISFIDYLIVSSDSGRIVILEYNPTKNIFERVHQETYGKSGNRRIVPGQYIAADPKGRAVIIGKD